MRCDRCQNVPPEVDVDCLLFSVPEAFVADRLSRALAHAGATLEKCDLGLKMPCRGIDWKPMLQSAAKILSGPERHDVRVALVPRCEGPSAIQKAIFNSRRIDELLGQLESEWLRAVLARDAIAIHFQPLIQHPPGRLHGYECLMRGVEPNGKLISPAKMFAAARSLDLLFLLDQKCRLAAVRRAAQLGLRDVQLFINFLPTAIYNPAFCLKSTMAAVDEGGLRPEQVTFEVVESEHVADRAHLAEILRYYRAHGFKVALDDVGAGYSSLLALADLRPDYLKLDAELVRRAARSSFEAKIVRDLSEAARQHGIITIAEGIETQEELNFVFSTGIRITQGYLHAKPDPQPRSSVQAQEIIGRVKAAYDARRQEFKAAAPAAWDITGLYQTLSNVAKETKA